jgi:exosortase
MSQAVQPVRAKALAGTVDSAWIWQAALLVMCVAWLYGAVLARLAAQWWRDPNFSHGFLVPVFAGYVIWSQREHLGQLPVRPSWAGLPVLFVAMCLLVVGVLGVELFLTRASLLLAFAGLVIYFMGWQFLRAVLFPLAFLLLMIPLPAILFNQITFPLQLLASKLASALLPLAGVPVLREGNVIMLPAMTLEVAEACSGIRSLMSLLTLAVVYGYVLETRTSWRVLLALAALPIAVLANSLRIVGTGLLVQYWDPDKAEGFFHTFSGWIIFVVSLVLLFLVHRSMKWIDGWRAGKAVA